MNPDLDDPNNHVPPVSPDDGWEELDEASEKSRMGLPPRKPDRGLPPRKESRAPQVNHHTAKLKLDQDGSAPPPGPKWGQKKTDAGDVEPPEDPGVRLPPPDGKRARTSAGPSTGKTEKRGGGKKGRKPGAGSARDADVGITEDAPGAEDDKGTESDPQAERIVLPSAPLGKRFRVNKIDPAIDAATNRIPKMTPSAAAGAKGGNLGDVPRMRRSFGRGESGSWGEKATQGSVRWMAYTGVGILALVVIVVTLNHRSGDKTGRGQSESIYSQLEAAEPLAPETGGALDELATGQEDAKALFGKFAAALAPDEVMGIFIDAERNGELIRKNWKPLGIKPGWQPGEDAVWTVLEWNGLRYGVLEGGLPDFSRFTAYFRRVGGALLMDWKASTGYGSAGFAELNAGDADGSEIRAWISLADFYTFSLPEGEFRSFRLMSPDGESSLWAYTRVGSELDGRFISLFTPSQITGEIQSEVQVTLGLQPGPEESLPNQWMIGDLLRLDWLDE